MTPRRRTPKKTPRARATPAPPPVTPPTPPAAPRGALYHSPALTVTATTISVAPLGGGGTEPTIYPIRDVARVELKTISDATAPFVKVLLYIMFGVGLLGCGITGLCALDPTINAGMLAHYHLDMASLLPYAGGFTLMMYCAVTLNDRMKVLLLTLTSGERRELVWATTKGSLDEARKAKTAIVEAHALFLDAQDG